MFHLANIHFSFIIFRVPQPVLKAKCAESLKCLAQMMEAYHETGRASLLMGVSISYHELNRYYYKNFFDIYFSRLLNT